MKRYSRTLFYFELFLLCSCAKCLSYVEKGMLDRLLTYYDDKVRPADKRNFLADPNSPPVIINATLAIRHMTFRDFILTLDLEVNEAWYDSRLQGSEKVRPRFQLPSDMKIWVPNGIPITTSASPICQKRKLFMSDVARLESQCRFVIQVDCRGGYVNFPFDSHNCLVEIEAADSTDVSYMCDACLDRVDQSAAPAYFTVRSYAKTHSLIKSDGFIFDTTTVTPGAATGANRLKRKKRVRKPGKTARTAKKRTNSLFDIYDDEFEDEELDEASRIRLAIGRTIAIEIVLTRSATGYYIITALLPAILLVSLAWISMFNQRKTIKISLQSTALFALIILWGNHRDMPTVTALDLWLLFCLCFICASIFESALLTLLPSMKRTGSRISITKRTGSNTSVNRILVTANDTRNQPNGKLLVHVEHCGHSVRKLFDQEHIHWSFIIMYPITFIVVSLIFWLPKIP